MGLEYDTGASTSYRMVFGCTGDDLQTVYSGNAEELSRMLSGVGFDTTGLGLRLEANQPLHAFRPVLTQDPDTMQEGEAGIKFTIGAMVREERGIHYLQHHQLENGVPGGLPYFVEVCCAVASPTYNPHGTSIDGPILRVVELDQDGPTARHTKAEKIAAPWQRTLTQVLRTYSGEDDRSVGFYFNSGDLECETMDLRMAAPRDLDLTWLRLNARGVFEGLVDDPDFQNLVAMQQSIYEMDRVRETDGEESPFSLDAMGRLVAEYVTAVPSDLFGADVQQQGVRATSASTILDQELVELRKKAGLEYEAAVQAFVADKVTEGSDLVRLLRAA